MAEPGGGSKDRRRPRVYSIPLHRSFADALVNGLLARTANDRMRLARATILTASNRAARTINEAFVRRAEGGLLLPRIVPIGEAGEALAADLFDSADPLPARDRSTASAIAARPA